ncbi:MAG: hypothetical protein HC822_03305, partial [Oscillochloris sp.]|nr:hypothetical protein [Oscillochloris sp.]
MINRFRALMFVLAAASLIAACGGAPRAQPTTAPAAEAQPAAAPAA